MMPMGRTRLRCGSKSLRGPLDRLFQSGANGCQGITHRLPLGQRDHQGDKLLRSGHMALMVADPIGRQNVGGYEVNPCSSR